MKLSRGDVVLVPFPFTHLKAQKVRPAVILSPKISDHGDVLLAFISSVMPPQSSEYDVVLLDSDPDFPQTGLKVNSVFRMDKLVTLHVTLILRHLGRAPSPLRRKLDKALAKAVGLA
jgi:mRNA interferase MazF